MKKNHPSRSKAVNSSRITTVLSHVQNLRHALLYLTHISTSVFTFPPTPQFHGQLELRALQRLAGKDDLRTFSFPPKVVFSFNDVEGAKEVTRSIEVHLLVLFCHHSHHRTLRSHRLLWWEYWCFL